MLSNKQMQQLMLEIADELFISENTLKNHKANMLGKTGFPKAVDLAFYMIENGWINPMY